jgi:hypothetical protein
VRVRVFSQFIKSVSGRLKKDFIFVLFIYIYIYIYICSGFHGLILIFDFVFPWGRNIAYVADHERLSYENGPVASASIE